MATTTTNFGWDIPQSTDLVKDGATAIAALGQDIDTSMMDLKGGTTGQVLSKASNTDMDFSWVAQDDSNAIQNAIVDAKGDIITATGADTPARLAVGANDLVLTAASGETTGLKYTGAWTDFTPTYTGVTIGNGTNLGRYCKIGKVMHVWIYFALGSTSSITGNIVITNMPGGSSQSALLETRVSLEDVGVRGYTGGIAIYGATGYLQANQLSGGNLTGVSANATTPFTWGSTDRFIVQATYEVA